MAIINTNNTNIATLSNAMALPFGLAVRVAEQLVNDAIHSAEEAECDLRALILGAFTLAGFGHASKALVAATATSMEVGPVASKDALDRILGRGGEHPVTAAMEVFGWVNQPERVLLDGKIAEVRRATAAVEEIIARVDERYRFRPVKFAARLSNENLPRGARVEAMSEVLAHLGRTAFRFSPQWKEIIQHTKDNLTSVVEELQSRAEPEEFDDKNSPVQVASRRKTALGNQLVRLGDFITRWGGMEFHLMMSAADSGRLTYVGGDISPSGAKVLRSIYQFSRATPCNREARKEILAIIGQNHSRGKIPFGKAWRLGRHIVMTNRKSLSLAERQMLVHKNHIAIWLDACASMFQILSIGTGNMALAAATNVVTVKDDRGYPVIGDVHTQVAGATGLSRDQAKKLGLMTYGISDKSLSKELGMTREEIGSLKMRISRLIPVEILKDLIATIPVDRLEAGVSFTAPDGVTTSITHIKWDRVKVGDVSIRLFDTKAPDVEKRRRAILPLLVHACDSYILRCVVKELAAQDIPVMTIHDAFGVPAAHAGSLRRAYLNALKALAEKDVFRSMLVDAGVNPRAIRFQHLDANLIDNPYALMP